MAYQKILQLSYVDKFLSDIQLEFRNKYKDELTHGNVSGNFDFASIFHDLLRQREEESKLEARAPKLVFLITPPPIHLHEQEVFSH